MSEENISQEHHVAGPDVSLALGHELTGYPTQ